MGIRWGRSSFKLGNWVAEGNTSKAAAWVEHNQRLFDRDEVWLRVFKENAGWGPIPAGAGMFGSPPRDPGVWDVDWLQGYWDPETLKARRVRPEHITSINRRVTEWFFRTSHETGCGFELVIVATLKHTELIGNGHIDHIIRQELIMFDELKEKYPNAKIIASACNEWDAHHLRRDPWGGTEQLSVNAVNMWAVRRGRDGYGFFELIVDHGGRNDFDYKVGSGRDTYDWGMVHPVRSGEWWKAPPTAPIVADCHGKPYGATESMYYVQYEDRVRAETWYRNRAGWQTNVEKQMTFYENLEGAGFSYIIVHDEKGAQSDVDWPRARTTLEDRLAEKFGGTTMGLKFERIIRPAYLEILDRPVDDGGLESYNRAMHQGMSKAQMEEHLLRSKEYADKNPEGAD